jgi:hypothetical protein
MLVALININRDDVGIRRPVQFLLALLAIRGEPIGLQVIDEAASVAVDENVSARVLLSG